MLTDPELRLFYAEQVEPALKQIEREKEKQDDVCKRNLLIALAFCVIGTVLILCFFQEIPFLLPAAGSCILLLIVYSCSKFDKQGCRSNLFYSVIVPALMNLSGLTFKKKHVIAKKEYHTCRLFPRHTDSYSGGDFVSGCNKKTGFAFSYLHTERREIVRNNEKTVERWYDIFNGILWIADFNKHFHGITVVLPDHASWFTESWFGHFFEQSYWDNVGSLTKMEDVEFEKKFRVFTSDNVEARYILTPMQMSRITALLKKNGNSPFMIAFADSKMYVAFPGAVSPFVYCGEELSFRFIKSFHDKVAFYYDLVSCFDLNTRIWTK